MVGQLGIVQIGGRRRIPEKAAERGERQVTACRLRAGITGKRSDEKPELAPEIAVARALEPARKLAQPRSAVVSGIAFAGGPRGVGVVPRVEQRLTVQHAVLCNEEEDEAIHHAQELAVEVVQPERPAAQGISQRAVPGVARESLAETLQCMLDAAAQLAERTGALPFGLAGPFFEPAGLGVDRHRAVVNREACVITQTSTKSENSSPEKIASRSNSRKDWRDSAWLPRRMRRRKPFETTAQRCASLRFRNS